MDNIADLYTDREIAYMFSENPGMSAEFDSDFLGFSQLYAAASRVLPKRFHQPEKLWP